MRAEGQAHIEQIEAALALVRKFLDWDRALRRLEAFYHGGISNLAHGLLKSPPHSPFSTLMALVGFLFFGEKLSSRKTLALCTGFIGILVLASGKMAGMSVGWASLAGALASVLYGLGIHMARRYLAGLPAAALALLSRPSVGLGPVAAIGIVGLSVAVAVAMFLLVEANVSKERLEATVSRALGLELRIDGPLGTAFFPGLLG